MVATQMKQLDELDRKILREMQRDASLPVESLGERIGLSRNACWRRVKALEESGVIRRRVALVDPEALDLGLAVFIAVRTDRHDAAWAEIFAKAVRELPEVIGAYRMTGDLDYLVHARVADMKAYDGLYRRLIARVELKDVSASFMMEELKETTELPVF